MKRPPDFPQAGRMTWIEKTADRLGINRVFLRRPPLEIHPNPDQVLSPAQAKVDTLMEIGSDGMVEDKRILGRARCFSILNLLRDEERANQFIGGMAVKLYLAPWDLHFLLFPVAGTVTWYRYFPGYAIPLLLFKSGDILNERLCALIETDQHYPVMFVMIGSWMVNGIHHSFELGQPYSQGADFGQFAVGSSVVMVFPKGKIEWECQVGRKVRLGEPIARLAG
jgi:phosphatidylserine decarboxylase